MLNLRDRNNEAAHVVQNKRLTVSIHSYRDGSNWIFDTCIRGQTEKDLTVTHAWDESLDRDWWGKIQSYYSAIHSDLKERLEKLVPSAYPSVEEVLAEIEDQIAQHLKNGDK